MICERSDRRLAQLVEPLFFGSRLIANGSDLLVPLAGDLCANRFLLRFELGFEISQTLFRFRARRLHQLGGAALRVIEHSIQLSLGL